MPAEAGIQALNGIARSARDFKTYLWVADPQVHVAEGDTKTVQGRSQPQICF